MKTFEIIIYDIDVEVEYEHRLIKCNNYYEMMHLAEQRCQEIMEEKDLLSVCWGYKEVV